MNNQAKVESRPIKFLGKFRWIVVILPALLQPFTSGLMKWLAIDLTTFNVFFLFRHPLFYLILLLFVVRLVFWQLALMFFPLSTAYPLQSVRYVFLLVISFVFFEEAIHWSNLVGTSLIVVGIYFVTRSSSR